MKKKCGNVITPTAEPVTTTETLNDGDDEKKNNADVQRRRNIAIEIRNAIGPLKISHNNNIIHSSTHRTHNDDNDDDSNVHIAALAHQKPISFRSSKNFIHEPNE